MKKIQCYDNRGKERWMSTGQTIPAGWYNSKAELLTVDHIVKIHQHEKGYVYLTLEPISIIKQ